MSLEPWMQRTGTGLLRIWLFSGMKSVWNSSNVAYCYLFRDCILPPDTVFEEAQVPYINLTSKLGSCLLLERSFFWCSIYICCQIIKKKKVKGLQWSCVRLFLFVQFFIFLFSGSFLKGYWKCNTQWWGDYQRLAEASGGFDSSLCLGYLFFLKQRCKSFMGLCFKGGDK